MTLNVCEDSHHTPGSLISLSWSLEGLFLSVVLQPHLEDHKIGYLIKVAMVANGYGLVHKYFRTVTSRRRKHTHQDLILHLDQRLRWRSLVFIVSRRTCKVTV